ncbi:MAG TPA: Lrp/AsnC family transcriptional regulator [Rhodoblastus sp.]|nr:Lrp/AsnC family transcriptional regulator [Rhodoblastus sp.]
MEPDSTEIDAIDRRILARLQRDASIQNQQLAGEVGLSPSPCHRRVRALEEARIIRGYVALLDGPSIGAGFLAYVEVRLERQAMEFSERFEKAVLARAEILECVRVTGDYDYLLKVATRDIEAFHRFLIETLTRIKGIANTRTSIALNRVKETTALPIG